MQRTFRDCQELRGTPSQSRSLFRFIAVGVLYSVNKSPEKLMENRISYKITKITEISSLSDFSVIHFCTMFEIFSLFIFFCHPVSHTINFFECLLRVCARFELLLDQL